MLGFSIAIFPEEHYIQTPKYWQREERWSAALASWQTFVGGTNWIDDLVKEGKAAMSEDSTGYPSRYRCKLSVISKILRGEIPAHKGTPGVGEDYFLAVGWVWKTELYPERIAQYPEDSMVIIQTMDLS